MRKQEDLEIQSDLEPGLENDKSEIHQPGCDQCSVTEDSEHSHIENTQAFVQRIRDGEFESFQDAAGELKELLVDEPEDSTQLLEDTYKAFEELRNASGFQPLRYLAGGGLIATGKYVTGAAINGILRLLD